MKIERFKQLALVIIALTAFLNLGSTDVFAADWFVAQSPLIYEGEDFSMSSPFWADRSFGGSNPHNGLDIVKSSGSGNIFGTPIYSMADGVVIRSFDGCSNRGFINNSCGGGLGNNVIVYHGTHRVLNQDGVEVVSDIFIKYGHLRLGSNTHLNNGDTINAGELIGEVASSGSSTGDHLHVEIAAPGEVGQNGQYWGSVNMGIDRSSPQPYIWPEGGKTAVRVPFKPDNTLYNALGEPQGPGAVPSGIGVSGGDGTESGGMRDLVSEEWMTPKVNFIDRTYVANTRGVSDNDSALLTPTTLVGFTRFANNVYHWSFTATLFLSILFLVYMSLVTIYYLVLLPRSNTSWKLADLFEKTTGIDAVVTKKNTLDIIGRDLIAILFIAIVLSGAYTHLYNLIYSLILQIF